MAQWGSQDVTSNSVIWAPATVSLTPNVANRDLMYGNTTGDAFITGQTIGMYGVDETEIAIGAIHISAVEANNVGTGGNYIPGETLTLDATGATGTAATLTVSATQVRTVAAVAGGSGYANGDTVTCNTGVMSTNAVFTVTTGAADDIIASLALTGNGVFTTNPTLTGGALKNIVAANSSANGATGTVTMKVKTLGVLNRGNYSVAPTTLDNNTLAGSATGTGATAALTTATASKGITHTGWIKRTTGTGGRADRIQTEVLVAGGITGDGTDDAVFPDA